MSGGGLASLDLHEAFSANGLVTTTRFIDVWRIVLIKRRVMLIPGNIIS